MISIHALREEGDRHRWPHRDVCRDFYPRPPRGGRPGSLSEPHRPVLFLSTPSARRATVIAFSYAILQEFLSTPSVRRATKGNGHGLLPERFLSTPSARRATWHQYGASVHQSISIHALREEGDGSSPIKFHARRGFLSTPSARRATKLPPRKRSSQKNFYPRPPRGGRQSGHPALDAGVRISIHALREEGDPKMVGSRKRY